MTSARINDMRNAREIPHVLLQQYNKLRSTCSGVLVFAFEGYDDVTFYDTAFSRILGTLEYKNFICKGKDKVLELRSILARNVSADAKLVYYFVDKDFDHLKGHPPGPDIYCTPCYSFENIIVGEEVLKRLLRSEYRCHDEDADKDVDSAVNLFTSRLNEFLACIMEANKLIFYARKNGVPCKSIENNLDKYLKVSLSRVEKNSEAEAWQLVGLAEEIKEEQLRTIDEAFSSLDPCKEWRGKFIYFFFQKFLAHLKEDRGSKTPQYFSKRAPVSFSPSGDIVRALASIATLPDCLSAFATQISMTTNNRPPTAR